MNNQNDHINAALQIIASLGMPRAQQNERSALCLLALLNLTPDKAWANAGNPLMGITPIMDWAREHYGKEYAPNTRETFRRQSMHQFCDAGIALYNPDKPDRPVNSPKAVYQIEPAALALMRTFGTPAWHDGFAAYLAKRETLVARYAKEREQNRIPVEIAAGKEITLSPGEHSELIRAIIEDFAPRFAPGSVLVYAGDTGDKWGYVPRTIMLPFWGSISLPFHPANHLLPFMPKHGPEAYHCHQTKLGTISLPIELYVYKQSLTS